MSLKDDIQQIHDLSKIIEQHQVLLGYTKEATKKAITEMRADDGPLSHLMHQRADECEKVLEVIMEFHSQM